DLRLGQPVLLGGGHVASVGGCQFVGAGVQGGGGGEQPGVFARGRDGRQLARGGAGAVAQGGTGGHQLVRRQISRCDDTHGDGMPPRNGSRPGSGATDTSRNGAADGGSWAREKSVGNCTRTGSSA